MTPGSHSIGLSSDLMHLVSISTLHSLMTIKLKDGYDKLSTFQNWSNKKTLGSDKVRVPSTVIGSWN